MTSTVLQTTISKELIAQLIAPHLEAFSIVPNAERISLIHLEGLKDQVPISVVYSTRENIPSEGGENNSPD